ncbi:MAG: hypothetical protein QOI95_4346 [Acidimicrobiaceae bacterium]
MWAWVVGLGGPALSAVVWLPFRSSFGLAGILLLTLLLVSAASVLGGTRPAIAAVAVGVLAGSLSFAPPYGVRGVGLEGDTAGLVALVAFAVVGIGIAFLTDELRGLAEDQAALRTELAASRTRVVTAADAARRRIERNLHDGTQQRLVSLGLELRSAEQAMPAGMTEVRAHLAGVALGLTQALEDLQEIARGIHPAVLTKGGLEPAVKMLARRSAIPVEVALRADGRLPERVEVAAYYVVAEALTNAAKHARASVVHVEAAVDAEGLQLSIRDDGCGGADTARGSGLIGLQDRVESIGGRIEITSVVGSGTSLMVTIPVAKT